MKFALLIYADETKVAAMTRDEIAERYGAFTAYVLALREAGAFVSSQGLQSTEHASTVHLRDGKPVVQDGPFAESKDQVGGVFVIEAADMDAALEWAARHSALPIGAVEVRPVWITN